MADDVTDLRGKAVRLILGQSLGLGQGASISTVQHARRRLQADNVIFRVAHGDYRFEDKTFAEWIKRIADE